MGTSGNFLELDVCVEDPRWSKEALKLQDHLQLMGSSSPWPRKVMISLLFTDDPNIQQINRDHRGQDKPTNVLSFQYLEGDNYQDLYQADQGDYPLLLGDIILSFDTIQKEATEAKKDFYDVSLYLMVHGVLHLLGYDHQEDDEAERMEALEQKIIETIKYEKIKRKH
jgi:probable rRNA maturation factor